MNRPKKEDYLRNNSSLVEVARDYEEYRADLEEYCDHLEFTIELEKKLSDKVMKRGEAK